MKKLLIALMFFVFGNAYAGNAEYVIGGMILGGAVVNEHHHHHYRKNQPVIVYQQPAPQYPPSGIPYYGQPEFVPQYYPQPIRCIAHPVIDVYGRIVAYQQICN